MDKGQLRTIVSANHTAERPGVCDAPPFAVAIRISRHQRVWSRYLYKHCLMAAGFARSSGASRLRLGFAQFDPQPAQSLFFAFAMPSHALGCGKGGRAVRRRRGLRRLVILSHQLVVPKVIAHILSRLVARGGPVPGLLVCGKRCPRKDQLFEDRVDRFFDRGRRGPLLRLWSELTAGRSMLAFGPLTRRRIPQTHEDAR
jgi:hypothetical protein